jgi:hypothetical protein
MENPSFKAQHKRGLEYNIGRVENISQEIKDGITYTNFEAKIILNPEIKNDKLDHSAIIHGLRHKLINGISM